jgi:hypothetical protein
VKLVRFARGDEEGAVEEEEGAVKRVLCKGAARDYERSDGVVLRIE